LITAVSARSVGSLAVVITTLVDVVRIRIMLASSRDRLEAKAKKEVDKAQKAYLWTRLQAGKVLPRKRTLRWPDWREKLLPRAGLKDCLEMGRLERCGQYWVVVSILEPTKVNEPGSGINIKPQKTIYGFNRIPVECCIYGFLAVVVLDFTRSICSVSTLSPT
jgi:hypothetical protein